MSGRSARTTRLLRLDALAELQSKELLPTGTAPAAQPQPVTSERRRQSARGALLGTAIGDALRRPAEGRHPSRLALRKESFRDFQPWRGYKSGPVGTVTDDTQLTMCVARSLLTTDGRLDPEDLARRLVAWLPEGRGKGRTCVAAINELRNGAPWWQAGQRSAGNGAAMRVAPIGIALGADTAALCEDAASSAVVTHADPMAVAATVAHAWLIARLAAVDPHTLDPAALVHDLAHAMSIIEDPGLPERDWSRRAGKTGDPVRLADRIREVPELLGEPPDTDFDHLYNGAFVLETLPAALWCFLTYVRDPEQAVVTAVLRGHDADTIASMTAAYLGALHGPSAFPARWTGANLEHRLALLYLADHLADLPGAIDAPRIAVPPQGAPWYMDGIEFALTYNGYDRHGNDELHRIGQATRDRYKDTSTFSDDLDTLRCALFWEQRHIRWNEPADLLADPHYAAYLAALLDRIRDLSGGSVPGPPDLLP